MIDLIQAGREESMVVVDSHALTIEHFGFRPVPYSAAQLISINFTWIVCLYAWPSVIQERIRIKPGGRPLPSEADLARHEQLQSALALTYVISAPRHARGAGTNCRVRLTCGLRNRTFRRGWFDGVLPAHGLNRSGRLPESDSALRHRRRR